MKTFTLVLSGIVLSLLLPVFTPAAPAQEKSLIVGSGRSADRIILGKLFIRLLEEKGFSCRDMTGLGSGRLVRSALLNKQIDLFPAYSGECPVPQPARGKFGGDPKGLFETVAQRDLAANGLVWLDMMAAEKIPRLWLKPRSAKARRLSSISDLAAFVRTRIEKPYLGLTPAFLIAPNGYRPLAQAYGLALPGDRIIKMDRVFLYPAVIKGGVEVAVGHSIDWEPARFGLVHLNDDLGFFRPNNPSGVVRIETARKYRDLKPILAELSKALTPLEMADLIGLIHDGVDYDLAVELWLRGKGLVAP